MPPRRRASHPRRLTAAFSYNSALLAHHGHPNFIAIKRLRTLSRCNGEWGPFLFFDLAVLPILPFAILFVFMQIQTAHSASLLF